MRLSATAALIERKGRDSGLPVFPVSMVFGDPGEQKQMMVSFRPGMEKDRDEVLRQLIDIQYDRNDMDFQAGNIPCKGRYV